MAFVAIRDSVCVNVARIFIPDLIHQALLDNEKPFWWVKYDDDWYHGDDLLYRAGYDSRFTGDMSDDMEHCLCVECTSPQIQITHEEIHSPRIYVAGYFPISSTAEQWGGWHREIIDLNHPNSIQLMLEALSRSNV